MFTTKEEGLDGGDIPSHPESCLDSSLVIAVRRSVRVPCISRERGELFAASRDRNHRFQVQRSKVCIKGIDRAPILALLYSGANEFLRNFLQKAL